MNPGVRPFRWKRIDHSSQSRESTDESAESLIRSAVPHTDRIREGAPLFVPNQFFGAKI